MKKISLVFLCLMLLLTACRTDSTRTGSAPRRSPSATQPPHTLTPNATVTPWPIASDTPTPTIAPTATVGVSFTHDAICRMGPGESYYRVTRHFEKGAVILRGRNEAADWVLVQDVYVDDPLCWIPVTGLVSAEGVTALEMATYPALPAVPTSISAPNRVCGAASPQLMVKWSPVAAGAQYRLYRNGELIATQTGGSYYDLDVPKPQRPVVYTYVLQTFNDYGNSPHTLSVSVAVCSK